ncbi:DUF3883 domain-containing protein [Myroides marinus]|uniref:DUF3883 domain-containing protein n=1 Tax=Myroides marinus TaxID=703342 RepID=UPI0025791E8F|nr:DUF3883 domain-containing protein [Myroides marinus]MDM1503796.1 DUF3883 domain-containing protein [Myroides marinus]
MESFFKINRNAKIGYKLLSPADLGTNTTSNQTHIGLFENTLLFIAEAHKRSSSKLIYNNEAKELICLIDYITNSDGTIRSPKIRKGDINELNIDGNEINSVVREIRSIVQNNSINSNWFLLWFGLDSNELVFYLFNEDSEEYRRLSQIIPNISSRGIIDNTATNFNPLVNYIEPLLSNSSISILQDLELIAQTNEVPVNIIKPRYFDIERAKLNFQLTGQKGEELIAEYLGRQKTQGNITNFNWVNQSRESSFPYDFQIINNDGSEIFTDVKTTAFDFNQKMIVSTNEFNFINQNPSNYHIYRVYNLNNNQPSLRICRNINQIGEHIINHTNQLTTNLSSYFTTIQSLKIAIQPQNNILNFDDTIAL